MQDQKTLDFIEKARKIHGNKFGYENTTYGGHREELSYFCPKHGKQIQKAGDHLRSKFGCPDCSAEQKNKGTKTTEQWIKDAKEAHGNQYDYSISGYINKRTKINIRCPKHNRAFSQFPGSHLQGYGCPECGIEKAKNTKAKKSKIQNRNFSNSSTNKKSINVLLSQFREVHGDKYDYSLLVYAGDSSKIKIVCKIHGTFEQIPSSHLRGVGCPYCAGRIKNTKMWIDKAREIHGDQYTYSKTLYRDVKTKLTITCKKHGDFEILPQKHILREQGCRKCGGAKLRNRFKKTTEDFILMSNRIHNDKYDYSKVKYIDNKTKVEIICKKHGSFWQSPNKHTGRGDGCPDCMLENRISSLDEVVEKAKTIHGDTYDYSSSLIDTNKKTMLLNIKCKKHGYFNQRLDGHLDGVGCPKCSATKGEKAIRKWLECNNFAYDEQARASTYFRESLFIQGIQRTFYDFLLPKQKIIIEYDGEQHFYPVDFQGKGLNEKVYDNFLSTIKRDHLKTELAKSSGYIVVRIPFWERDNIENILERLLIKKSKKVNEKITNKYSLQNNEMHYNCEILGLIPNESDEYL